MELLVNTRSEKMKLNKMLRSVPDHNKPAVNGLYKDAVSLLERMEGKAQFLKDTGKIDITDKEKRFNSNSYEVEEYMKIKTMYGSIVKHISKFATDTRSSSDIFAFGYGEGIIETR